MTILHGDRILDEGEEGPMSAEAVPRSAGLGAEVSASLREYWRRAAPYQRSLYWLAVVFLVSAAVHGAAFLLGDLPWDGPVSWRKPLLFSFYLGFQLPSSPQPPQRRPRKP